MDRLVGFKSLKLMELEMIMWGRIRQEEAQRKRQAKWKSPDNYALQKTHPVAHVLGGDKGDDNTPFEFQIAFQEEFLLILLIQF